MTVGHRVLSGLCLSVTVSNVNVLLQGDVAASSGERASKAAGSEDEEIMSDEDDDVESEDENVDTAMTAEVSTTDVKSRTTDTGGKCESWSGVIAS